MDFDVWFQGLCKQLEKSGKVQEISASFGKLETDLDRFDFTWKLPELESQLARLDTASKSWQRPKCADTAAKLRNQGNSAYQKRNTRAALALYNESLMNSPLRDASNTLALAHANRSATLYELKKYQLCLQDITLALENNYPKDLCYKLHERRANCFDQLQAPAQAMQSFHLAIDSVNFSNVDEDRKRNLKEGWTKRINCLTRIKEGTEKVIFNDIEAHQPAEPLNLLCGERNPKLPCALDKVQIAYSPQMGRHLIATDDIEPGTTIIEERPFSSVLLAEFSKNYCHRCLLPAEAPLPCLNCSEVVFCSMVCRNKALSGYHAIECGRFCFLHASNLGKNAVLAFRTVAQQRFTELLAFLDSVQIPEDPVQLGCNEFGVYDTSRYATVYHLITNTSQRTVADLFRRTAMAVFMTRVLLGSNYFPEGYKEADVLKIGSVLLRHLQNFPCNAHEVSHFHFDVTPTNAATPTQGSLREVGAAAFGCLSLINHSCDPNVVRHCYGDVVVVRTVRTIRKGEEVLDNYGYHYAVHPKADRQESLRKQYYFVCTCVACVEHWPLFDALDANVTLKYCDTCENSTGCSKCQEILQKIKESSESFQEALSAFISTPYIQLNVTENATNFRERLRILDLYLKMPCRDLNVAQEALKHALSLMATVAPAELTAAS